MATGNDVRRAQTEGNLVWLDLEMTGLDAERDVILQAALIVTDRELTPLEEFVCDVWQPEEKLALMTPFVRDMHTRTGLLDRVRASRLDLREAERELMARAAGWCPFPAVLCGNSIWADRKFVDRHMPGLARYLHYRMVDVSALKTLVGLWYPPGAAFQKSKEGAHDALVDIRASIAELRHYRTKILRPQAG
jgi:oligoribonuclease